MASDRDEQKIRRQRREAARRQRERARRRMYLRLAMALVALVCSGAVIWYFSTRSGQTPENPGQTANQPEGTPAPAERNTDGESLAEKSSIRLTFGGDINVTDNVVAAGNTGAGYDYSQVLLDAVPALAEGDLTIVNFEGNLCGEPYGTASASAPTALAQALADAGVDLVQMANSCTIRNGILGLSATLDGIHGANMGSLGAWATDAAFQSSGGYTIRQVGDLKVAIVAFTKGMDNLGLPQGSENCVNLLYDDYATTYSDVASSKILRILRAAAQEQPDFTVALLHWGSEYKEDISDSQKAIRNLMLENGVDAIIGTHPHLVQQVDFDQDAGTLVAYSLGDLLGDGEKSGSNRSIVLSLTVTKDNLTGETRITDYSYTPLYILKPEQSGETGLRVIRTEQAMAAFEAGFLDSLPEEVYHSLQSSLTAIQESVAGE